MITALAAAVVVPHLLWAQRLLNHLQPADNSYGRRPTVVLWRGVDGAARSQNRSDCSSFLTALLRQAYGLDGDDIQAWLGAHAPRAVDYHRAIMRGDRFIRIHRIADLVPGDLLVSRYLNRRSGATGHMMLVAEQPRLVGRCSPSVCLFRIPVIDSARSGHGPTDRRQGKGGVGRGIIQVQTSLDGRLLTYRWSERASSRWRSTDQESLVAGRFSW